MGKEEATDTVGQWLKEKCDGEKLSLRQAAARTGLSHAAIGDIISGSRPSPDTIIKLAKGFVGDGHQGLALQDKLLTLAGYRSDHKEKVPEPIAQLLDKLTGFNPAQLRLMSHFADFISGMEGE